jgi:signal transduction histidine kinase/Na+/proline symporter
MTFSLAQLFTISFIYLLTLFGSAYATEKAWLPKSITQHPFIRVAALGVFAGAIAFFGAFTLIAQFGSNYLLYFFGSSAVFLLAPLLLFQIARISLAHKLGSLADVFAFRYPSSWVGGVISMLMLLSVLPLIALQIHAASITVHLLNQDISEDRLAIIFCITMTVFAILFGARHASTRDKHEGLVFAMGLESIFKLLAFVAIALYAVFSVFGGFAEMASWLGSAEANAMKSQIMDLNEGSSRSLLLMFFAAALVMPHMFHLLLTENDNESLLSASRWGFPLYMFVLSLCIPPIFWAASYVASPHSAEFSAVSLGLTSNSEIITILAFLAGFAATSGVLIVVTLAMASMSLHHMLLPFYRPNEDRDFVALLLNMRRILIAGIILAAYGLYQYLDAEQSLMSIGFITFVATIQFLPGLIGGFYWRAANRIGLMSGLAAGFIVWFLVLLLPLVGDIVSASRFDTPLSFELNQSVWHIAALISLVTNSVIFIVASLLTSPTPDELKAAEECMSDSRVKPYQGVLVARSVPEIRNKLGEMIGLAAASQEVHAGLTELGFNEEERRAFALTRMRNHMESSLSSVVGQTIAHSIITRALPYQLDHSGTVVSESVQSMENRFEGYRSELTGLAAELDNLRRYHRQILQDLPSAVCSIDQSDRVLTWNAAMEELTNIPAHIIVDHNIASLPTQWFKIINEIALTDSDQKIKLEFNTEGMTRLLSLHKSVIATDNNNGDKVIVLEDITDEQILEQQLLHNQRLASIGQLAAGVAHEIGNPITGIACLAQNLKIETEQPELHELSEEILNQTDRVSEILKSLINFAHSGSKSNKPQTTPVELSQCIDEAINLLNLATNDKQISFANHLPHTLFTLGDGQRLLQVFINVLSNARDASMANGTVDVVGQIIDNHIRIEVIDKGHGIEAANLSRMFDPFFTTKDPGQGTGLGLAIVTTILQEHHGSISAVSGPVQGTHVIITLPHYDRPELDLTSTSKTVFS